jgi:hypothetical protein
MLGSALVDPARAKPPLIESLGMNNFSQDTGYFLYPHSKNKNFGDI